MIRSFFLIGLALNLVHAQDRYSLEDLLSKVIQENLELKASSSDVEASEFNLSAARAGHWPTLGLTAGYTEYLDDQRLAPAVRNNDPAVYSSRMAAAELKAKWIVYSGGKQSATEQLSASNLDALRNRQEQLKDQRKLDAVNLYYRILAEQQKGLALDSALGAATLLQQKVNALLLAQKAGRLDSLNVEVRLASLRQEKAFSLGLLLQWKRSMAVLLGRSKASAEFELVGTLDTNGLQSPMPALDWERIAAQNPTLLAYQSEEQGLQQKISIAQGNDYPTVSLQGNYGLRNAVGEPLRTDNGKNPAMLGSVGVYLDWNLFAGGADRSKVQEEKQRLRSLQMRRQQAELALRADLESILDRVQTAQSRVLSLIPMVELAHEAWNMELQRYENQRGTQSDALLAQSSWLQAQTVQSQSIAEWKMALAQWKIATGEL